jgi:multidrug efflux pump subunit AcrB
LAEKAKRGGHEITLSMNMSGEVEHIGKLVLAALGVSFGLLIVGYLMMPRLQQILGLIAIISIPFVIVGGFFLSAFFPQKKEVAHL